MTRSSLRLARERKYTSTWQKAEVPLRSAWAAWQRQSAWEVCHGCAKERSGLAGLLRQREEQPRARLPVQVQQWPARLPAPRGRLRTGSWRLATGNLGPDGKARRRQRHLDRLGVSFRERLRPTHGAPQRCNRRTALASWARHLVTGSPGESARPSAQCPPSWSRFPLRTQEAKLPGQARSSHLSTRPTNNSNAQPGR